MPAGSFPVTTIQRTLKVPSSSVPVEIVIQEHLDHWFLVITQYGKLGTLVRTGLPFSSWLNI